MQTILKTNVEAESLEPRPTVAHAADMDSDQELRANCYLLLGALLAAPPTRDIIERITSIEDVDPGVSPMAAAWRALKAAGESATDLNAVDDEYHSLFIGVGRGELMPFASWYLTGFLMEQPLAALRNSLARLGFERRENVKEPEDHAAALCETMGMIISGSDGVSFDQQKKFFASHIEPWIKQFFTDLRNADAARFYRGVGHFGESFIDLETQYFAMTA